jgi:hypothetical protein
MGANSETIYLIGTGFTKAVRSDAPLNKDLVKLVIRNGGVKLAEYRDVYKTDDIEKLLTYLDLDALSHEKVKKDRALKDRALIDAELGNFFTRYRFSELSGSLPTWLEILSLTTLKNNDSIISLNYDCLLEGVLDNYGVWSPNEGYARVFNYLSDSLPKNPKNIKIYKIHGSENFRESRFGNDPERTAIGYLINKDLYPKAGANSNLAVGDINSKPYIIAPSFVKIPHADISKMMLDVIDIANTARNFIIIGCRMRLEDSFLWLLLTRFLNNNILEYRKRLIILDPSPGTIWERISRYWSEDICERTDALVIPCGIEDGIQTINTVLNEKGKK